MRNERAFLSAARERPRVGARGIGLAILVVGFACVSLRSQTTAVSNLSQAFHAYVGPGVGSTAGEIFRDGFSFTTGSTTYSLNSVMLSGFGYGTGPTGFSLSLSSSISASGPSSPIVTFSGSSTLPANTTYTFTPSASTTLSASTTYWLIASSPSNLALNTGFSIPATSSTAEDAGALSGWSVGDSIWISANGGTSWFTNTSNLVQFSVQVTAIPEPATLAGWVGLGCALAAFVEKSRKRRHTGSARNTPTI